jgi:hypothetical protein
MEEQDAENADKEDKSAAGHLIYRHGCIKKTDIHELMR